MGRIAVFATAALGLLPTALSISAIRPPIGSPIGFPIGQGSCGARALGYLTCHSPLSPACSEQVAVQAAAFCSSYLSETATVFNTVTDISTATSTATEIFTSEATVIETSTSTTETTTTETSTEITTSPTSTFTAATSYVPPPPAVTVTFKRRDATVCPDLSKKALTRRPAAKISSVCSCLGVTATTATTTKTLTTSSTTTESTTTSTTTTETATTTALEVSVSTITTTTSTTTTSGTVATETAIVDYCDVTYNGGGTTPGNTVVRAPGDLDGRQCCVLCWNTPNCVASAIGLGFCQLLVKTSPLEGAPTSLQCPLGIENYTYEDGPGTLYRGPCSPGLN